MSANQIGYGELFSSHTGLASDKWSIYLPTYESLFNPLKGKFVRLLEIGVQNGGSLEIYSKFFSQASTILGVDIDSRISSLQFPIPSVQVIVGDATSLATAREISKVCKNFEFIIDDGSHDSRQIISAFCMYFPQLSSEGTYVVEDLHCSYELGYGGGLRYIKSSIEFFKLLIDVVNLEHWPTGYSRRRFERLLAKRFGLKVDLEFLSEIHSIEFKNSMVIIKKKSKDLNVLGERIRSGQIAPLTSENFQYAGQHRHDFISNSSASLASAKRIVRDFLDGMYT